MAATRKPSARLPGNVTGGIAVAAHDHTDHGLGKKDEFEKTLRKAAQEQGVDIAIKTPATTTDTAGGNENAIALPPMQDLLLKACGHAFSSAYSTEDPVRREAMELAERVVNDLIRELISPTAALYVPPDDFARMHRELRDYIDGFARELTAASSVHCKKLPINEASLRSKLSRDFRDPQFRHKHRELFGYLEAARTAQRAPEAVQRHIASGAGSAS